MVEDVPDDSVDSECRFDDVRGEPLSVHGYFLGSPSDHLVGDLDARGVSERECERGRIGNLAQFLQSVHHSTSLILEGGPNHRADRGEHVFDFGAWFGILTPPSKQFGTGVLLV